MSKLKIGDIVNWRGSYGNDSAKQVKITCIEVKGSEVKSVPWGEINNRDVVVDLSNGHWAYGYQLTRR